MPQVGEYVSIRYDGKNVLGMIENLVRGNVALNSEIYDVGDIETITQVSGNDLYVKGKVRLLGDVDDNLKLPRIPAPPGTPITKADDEILKKVFNLKNPLKLGTLVNQSDVEVNVDVNSIMNRHLAILAMTAAESTARVSAALLQGVQQVLQLVAGLGQLLDNLHVARYVLAVCLQLLLGCLHAQTLHFKQVINYL